MKAIYNKELPAAKYDSVWGCEYSAVASQEQRQCVSLTMRVGVKISDALGPGHLVSSVGLGICKFQSIVFTGNVRKILLRPQQTPQGSEIRIAAVLLI